MVERLIVGLMSGTSVDGVDAALVRVSGIGRGGGYGAEVVGHVERPWPRKLRERILAVMAPAAVRTEELCELNVRVAEEFAAAAEACIKQSGVRRRRVAAIASHGQTVAHLPPKHKTENIKHKTGVGRPMGSTLQIGDVSVIAALTGIVTVGDFRLADMAVGGQGAPLVPFADWAMFSDGRVVRCVQNIGGIANVTFLPKLKTQNSKLKTLAGVMAFDTGPGNMVMDAVVGLATGGRERFDRGGRLARRGVLDGGLFRELQGHAYFSRRPPKSTGREEFGVSFARGLMRKGRRVEDLVHTLCRWTAWSIADAYVNFLPELPDEVIVCGGGADNPVLMEMLGEELGELVSEFTSPVAARVRRVEEFGIPNKAKEAASFAVLGAASLDGVAGNVPGVTGASRGMVLGVVAVPTRSEPPRRQDTKFFKR